MHVHKLGLPYTALDSMIAASFWGRSPPHVCNCSNMCLQFVKSLQTELAGLQADAEVCFNEMRWLLFPIVATMHV